MTENTFERISKREWTNKAGEVFVYTSAGFFDSDKKGEVEWEYWKIKQYEWEFEMPDGKTINMKLDINKSNKALGKAKIGDEEFVIWTNSNDKWSWNSFKVWDIYFNVKDWNDKNGNPYYIVSYRLPKVDEDNVKDKETDFDL